MIPTSYFDHFDAPAKNSPVGKLMRKIHAELPHLDLETVRAEAREALLGVGGATRVQDAYKRWLIARSRASMTRKTRLPSATKALALAGPPPAPDTTASAISPSMSGTQIADHGSF
jgi:hypothetical protein